MLRNRLNREWGTFNLPSMVVYPHRQAKPHKHEAAPTSRYFAPHWPQSLMPQLPIEGVLPNEEEEALEEIANRMFGGCC